MPCATPIDVCYTGSRRGSAVSQCDSGLLRVGCETELAEAVLPHVEGNASEPLLERTETLSSDAVLDIRPVSQFKRVRRTFFLARP
jgi:hypothetical protein